MNFVSLLRSIEGGIYEIVVWAMLFPKTLIKTVFRPTWGATYINEEWQDKKEEDRFDEFLSPGLLWLIVSVLQVRFNDPIPLWAEFLTGVPGLEKMFGSFNSLEGEERLVVQILILLLYPFFYLLWMERMNETPIQRSTLKRLFQIQCYALAPAQFLGIITSAVIFPGLSIFFIWFYEIYVFRTELKLSLGRSIWHALVPQILLVLSVIVTFFAAFFVGS